MNVLAQRPFRKSALLLAVPCFVFMGIFFVYPVLKILTFSIEDQSGQLSTLNFVRIAENPVYFAVLATTFKIAFATTGLILLLGYPLAYGLYRIAPAHRNKYLMWVLIPFWTSDLVKAFSWVVLLGQNGLFNRTLVEASFTAAPLPLLHSSFGVYVGMTHALMPLAVLTILSVMTGVDGSLMRAANTLGAPPAHAFWRIFFPLTLPGIAAAGLLVFISALGFFVIPALLGSVRHTLLAQIIISEMLEIMNWGMAALLSLMLLVSAFITFWLYDKMLGVTRLVGEMRVATGRFSIRAFRAVGNVLIAACANLFAILDSGLNRVFGHRGSELALRVYVIVICMFLMIPSVIVFPMSFTSGAFLDFPPPGWSLRWFNAYFTSDLWIGATLRSFGVGICAATIALFLGSLAALALNRSSSRFNGVLVALLISPLIVPRVVIAVGMFYLFAQLGIVGTTFGLVLGHAVIAIPYVVITVSASLKSYDTRLDQAAATLGATPLKSTVYVMLPLLKGSVVVAFLFAFITSFDDLSIALFNSGGLVSTLPKMMWDDMTLQLNPTLAAASAIVTLLTLVVLAGAARAGRGATTQAH